MAQGNGNTSSTASTSPLRAPHDYDAERAVLGAMMLDNSVIPDVIQIIRKDDFYHIPHQLIFEGLVALISAGQPVDLTLLLDQLRKTGKLDEAGGPLVVAGLEQFVMATGGASALAEVVRKKATYRRLMRAAEMILQDSSAETRDVELQLDVAENLIFEISEQASPRNFVSIGELMPQAIEEVGRLQHNKGEIPGQPTHMLGLDRKLNGLHKSDLIILAARPSIGKTAFALNLMLNIAVRSRIPVGIFSLEMGREQLNMRLLSMFSRIPQFRIRSGKLSDHEFSHLRDYASQLQDVPIYIDDSPGLSLLQLRSQARRFASQHKNLGLLVVDYLQLMSGNDRGREHNRQQEVSEISRGLKALARDLQVPVLALSQLSRNIEQRSSKKEPAKPMLSDLRESGSIEQDADVVIFLHRDRKGEEVTDNAGNTMSLPIPTEIIIEKHRNGPTGTVDMLFFRETMTFADEEK
ncbi:replicative DNA helicase [Candidatus Sumerlaeota bacterium]|nr:replicative DNA helicase [Candidatus Sumerlaeota bacterium]